MRRVGGVRLVMVDLGRIWVRRGGGRWWRFWCGGAVRWWGYGELANGMNEFGRKPAHTVAEFGKRP